MSKPKVGTLVHIEVIKGKKGVGMQVGIEGSEEDLLISIITAMDNSEEIRDIFLDAAKQFMLNDIQGKMGNFPPNFQSFMQGFKDAAEDEVTVERKKKPQFDFSDVKDLLTEEEKALL